MKIPNQYLPVMPYLILEQTKSFLEFSKAVFGATEQLLVPNTDGSIMHAEIRIGDAVIMVGQASETWKAKTAAMYLHVENVDKTYHLALENGAVKLEEPQMKEYGYNAGFEDPYSNQWFIVQAER